MTDIITDHIYYPNKYHLCFTCGMKENLHARIATFTGFEDNPYAKSEGEQTAFHDHTEEVLADVQEPDIRRPDRGNLNRPRNSKG